jgi:hypothetical protein
MNFTSPTNLQASSYLDAYYKSKADAGQAKWMAYTKIGKIAEQASVRLWDKRCA